MTIKVPPDVTPVLLPQFQGRATANQTFATTNTYLPVALGAEDVKDISTVHSTSTNTSRFVAPTTGRYSCAGGVLVMAGQATTSGTQVRLLRLTKNGTIAVPGSSNWQTYLTNPATSSGFALTMFVGPLLVALNAGDYIELSFATGLANTQLAASTDEGSWLRVDFVR